MVQPIYTSVNNANIVACRKNTYKSDPIPLLKEKYLSEFRTDLEKAKVRRNLGISDDITLTWGNIKGFVEAQKDLVEYIEQKWKYLMPEDITNIEEELNTIQDAVNYAIKYVSTFKSDTDSIIQLKDSVSTINNSITTILQNIQNNSDKIFNNAKDIVLLNSKLSELNEFLKSIDVDKQILAWVENSILSSKGIVLVDNTLDVNISNKEKNALKLESDGLYVQDLSEQIENLGNYDTNLEDTTTAPETIGGIQSGTPVSQLKGKSIIEILDTVIFPEKIRNLIYPTLKYSSINRIVKVGDPLLVPTLIFTQNDAGEEISRSEEIIYGALKYTELTYNNIGEYIYKGEVSYNAGEYLLNNKNEITSIRVESGKIDTTARTVATYPWYAGNTETVTELTLIEFNIPTPEINISLSGNAVIKLPGANSKINSFKVDGGLGFLDVDMSGWIESTETIGGIIYKVWTKTDEYSSKLNHKITFKLTL